MLKLNELTPEIVDIIVRVDFDHTASPKLRYRAQIQPAQPSLESVGVSDLTITLRKNSTTFTLDVATLDSILRTSHATTLTLTSPPKRDPADQLTSQIDFIGPDLKTLHLHLPNPSLRTLQVPNPLSYTEVESILALPSMEGLKNIERE